MLTTSIPSVLAVFLLSTVALHLYLVKFRPLSEAGCKKIDYWWLGIAALGLVGAVGNARRLRAPWEIPIARARAEGPLISMRILASGTYHCTKFQRSEWSPPNLDELQVQQDTVCAWMQRAMVLIPDSVRLADTTAPLFSLEPPASVAEDMLKAQVREVSDFADQYRTLLRELAATVARGEQGPAEITLTFLGPILLAFALALRITKVSAELRLLRLKAKPMLYPTAADSPR